MEAQTVTCTYNGVFRNDDSNMIFFVGSAPNDDYYRFGKIKFFYATDTGNVPSGSQPTAQAGQSSGHCAWRA